MKGMIETVEEIIETVEEIIVEITQIMIGTIGIILVDNIFKEMILIEKFLFREDNLRIFDTILWDSKLIIKVKIALLRDKEEEI